MAPKAKAAAAKPAAKAKPEAKVAKTKEKEKIDIPKVPAPDREKFDEKVKEADKEISALQEKQKALATQIAERSHGKDEFQTQKAEIRKQLDICSDRINEYQEKKDVILKRVGAERQQNREMKQEISKLKGSIGFQSTAEIEARIDQINYNMMHETMTLKEEKKCIAEIAELKKNRPKVAHLQTMEENASAKPVVDVTESLDEINEQLKIHKEAKRLVSARYSGLMDERKKQMGDMPELFEERDKINKEIGEKIKERGVLRDAFREEEREHHNYMNELRSARLEKSREEREKRQKEWEMERRKREVDKLEDAPFVSEMMLVEQTINFCKGMLPKDANDVQQEKQEIQHNLPEGTTLLPKKDSRAPKAKAKSGAKQGAGKQKAASKTIKHNVQTFHLFEKLKVDAPITIDDIPGCLEQLVALRVEYQMKTKEFEAKREELRRQIMDGAAVDDVLGTDNQGGCDADADAGNDEPEATAADTGANDALAQNEGEGGLIADS